MLRKQQVGEEIESIFVSGKRRAYQGNFSELENPTAVQLIDGELLRDVGALNLNDALDLSASVSRQNNFGGLWNSFSIRGFSGDINLPSGFLVNGFNAGRGFGGPRDIVGIESVEILKGPRSALFGRGEPGGTINLTTKRPQFRRGGEFRATAGRWDQLRLEGDVQTTVGSNDQVGVRLVGFFEDSESFRKTVEKQSILGFIHQSPGMFLPIRALPTSWKSLNKKFPLIEVLPTLRILVLLPGRLLSVSPEMDL